MKKIISTIALLSLVAGSAFAFSAREHAAVAVIAEKYLTPKAQATISEICDGQKMMRFASDPDKYRQYDLYQDKTIGHVATYDSDFKPTGNVNSSPIEAVERAARALGNGRYKTLSQDSCKIYIGHIVHFIGDMHCPSHIKYDKATSAKSPKYFILCKLQKDGSYKNEKKINFHGAWDHGFCTFAYNGGPTDLAFLADIASKKEIKDYQAGDIRSWATENAKYCYPFTHDLEVEPEGNIVDMKYYDIHADVAKNQIMKAGYRLAAYLNALFK